MDLSWLPIDCRRSCCCSRRRAFLRSELFDRRIQLPCMGFLDLDPEEFIKWATSDPVGKADRRLVVCGLCEPLPNHQRKHATRSASCNKCEMSLCTVVSRTEDVIVSQISGVFGIRSRPVPFENNNSQPSRADKSSEFLARACVLNAHTRQCFQVGERELRGLDTIVCLARDQSSKTSCPYSCTMDHRGEAQKSSIDNRKRNEKTRQRTI